MWIERECESRARRKLFRGPNADLIQVLQQVGRIFVNAIRICSFKLALTVTALKQSHSKGRGAPRRKQIPNTVAYNVRRADFCTESFDCCKEEVRIRFGIANLISCNYYCLSGINTGDFQTKPSTFHFSAACDGPRNSCFGEILSSALRRAMLINAIDKRSVQVEQESRAFSHATSFGILASRSGLELSFMRLRLRTSVH